MNTVCPCCGGLQVKPFFEKTGMPASIGVQWDTRSEAKNCRRGDIRLQFCGSCGLIWNDRFKLDLLEYSERYDNSLEHSPRFRAFAEELARRLVDEYEIRGKRVVDIGCGKGHFLGLLCRLGGNTGIGFDPSFEGGADSDVNGANMLVHREFFSERHVDHEGDLVCCRHVLEHIPDPLPFLRIVRRAMDKVAGGIAYFEVPDVRFILEDFSIWDVIYEHCNYFGSESLRYCFENAGFKVISIDRRFGGQFLSIDARPGTMQSPTGPLVNLEPINSAVTRFVSKSDHLIETWADQLTDWESAGRCAVLWGGGSKAVSFLNILNSDRVIDHVVDINPNKQGRHIPGTGQRIVSPEELIEIKPDVVVVMNPNYREEIKVQLMNLGIKSEIVSV